MYGKNKQYGKAPAATAVTLDHDHRSITFWVALGIIVIFLFWAPFQRGLFNGYTSDFDSPIITSYVWSSILMILLATFLYSQWQLKGWKDFTTLAVWLLPLSYLLSSIHAVSAYFSINMTYLHVMYALFFIIGVYLTRNSFGNQLVQKTFLLSGYAIVWFGLFYWFGSPNHDGNPIYTVFNWFGLANYRDAVIGYESSGYRRLTSVFQYANTYAAILMAILLGCLVWILQSKKLVNTLLHAFMLVPISISFFLTVSRGALVLLPIILVLSLFLFSLYRQIILMVYMVLTLIGTVIILGSVTTIGEDLVKQYSASTSWKGWLIVLGTSVVLSIIIASIQKYGVTWLKIKLNKYNVSRYAVLAIPLSSILLGGLAAFLLFGNTGVTKLLPETLMNRIENINFTQNSVLERGTFYKDSFKLVKDYPLLGAGGGGWAALYEKYQNNPYTSRQAHNFYLQYLVEVGIIGTLILTAFIGFVFYLFIRFFLKKDEEQRDRRLLYALVTISILIHSIIDFNMSYAYIALLLFLCMGGMIAESEEGNGKLLTKMKSGYYKVFPATLGVLAIVFFIISLRMLSADRLYASAYAGAQNGKPFQEIMTELDKAIDRNPKHPDYMLFKANLLVQAYQQTKDEKYYSDLEASIQKVKRTEPNNRYVMEAQYNQNILKSNFLGARNVLIDGLGNFPWELSVYERLIALDVQLGNEARNEKNTSEMDQYWDHALELYNVMIDKTKELELLPEGQVQGREFLITKTIAFNIGQIDFIRGDFPAASEVLKIGVTDQLDDQQTRVTIRWYLASLQRQQKNDQELYDKLIANDANEANEVQKLVTAELSVQ